MLIALKEFSFKIVDTRTDTHEVTDTTDHPAHASATDGVVNMCTGTWTGIQKRTLAGALLINHNVRKKMGQTDRQTDK